MSEKPSFYELLGVTEDATDAQIRSAYYKIAKTAHPDRNTDSPTATEEFKLIAQAYETLKDAEKRKRYDLYGDESLNQKSGIMADPALRSKIWAGAVASYFVICLIDWYIGVGVEWLLAILVHLVVIIFVNKSLARHDFVVWGATLFFYFLTPVWITLPLARIMFVVALVVAPNILGIDPDFIVIFANLGLIFECTWRNSPVYWKFAASYGLVVFSLISFISVGYILEYRVPVSASYIVDNWNPIGFLPAVVSFAFLFLDWVGSFLVPNAFLHWTFPSTWLVITIALAMACLWGLYAMVKVWLLGLGVTALLGYFLAPYLPTKLTAFLIAVSFHIVIAALVRAVEVGIDQYRQLPLRSVLNYNISVIISVLWDILVTNHSTSFGAAQWVTFGSMLACMSLVLNLVSLILSNLSISIADEILKNAAQEQAKEAENETSSQPE